MEYYIAVFKSRTQTMKFQDRLRRNGLAVSIVNTPRQASLGCGLSVKFSGGDLEIIKNILTTESYHSFGGIFFVTGNGNNLSVSRLQF